MERGERGERGTHDGVVKRNKKARACVCVCHCIGLYALSFLLALLSFFECPPLPFPEEREGLEAGEQSMPSEVICARAI